MNYSKSQLEKVVSLLSYERETGKLSWNLPGGKKHGKEAGTRHNNGPIRLNCCGVRICAHQIVWYIENGKLPDNSLYHRNHDRSDNRIENLVESQPASNAEIISAETARKLFDYNPESGDLTWRVGNGRAKIGEAAGSINDKGYLSVMVGHRAYLGHRLIWLIVHGVWPPETIDHQNRIKSDNRLNNLRLASKSDNCCNKAAKQNASGYPGANRAGRKYRVRVTKDGERKAFGTYSTPERAHEVYKTAVKKMHGKFAREI